MFDKELLKECNGCAYTGVETVKRLSLFDGVCIYESKTQEHNNIRLVFSDNGVSVCGVLLRKHNKSKYKAGLYLVLQNKSNRRC